MPLDTYDLEGVSLEVAYFHGYDETDAVDAALADAHRRLQEGN